MAGNAQTILSQFNQTIDKWIGFLDEYTLDELCQQPRPNSWSLGQVYRHIIDDTTWFVEQIQITLSNDNSDADKKMHPQGRVIFDNKGFADVAIEGPATNTYIPQPPDKETLRQELLHIQNNVNHLFAAKSPIEASGKTRHPGLGYFNALEWLEFAEMHMRHHLRQKQRIDEKIRS